jgi:hypothetical protein
MDLNFGSYLVALTFEVSDEEFPHLELLLRATVAAHGTLDKALACRDVLMGKEAERSLREQLPRWWGGVVNDIEGRIVEREIFDAIRDQFGDGFIGELRKRLEISPSTNPEGRDVHVHRP